MQRRTFLAASAAALTGGRRVLAADAEIELTPGSPGAEISPHLYGHFIEHLGGVIYDGIWVGKASKIANTGGIRTQFIEDMKRIGAPNLRWPGGCFADGYHWRDGIGPAAQRPRTYNYWQRQMPKGSDATESNQFGLHEFMRLCRLVGAQPYLAANVGSGSPKEFHDWVSYCNAPAGTLTLADERAANGDRAPFAVQFWGVGNESWGCGGTMRPGEYATQYRQFVTQFPAYTAPFLVATGPRGHSADGDIGWTTGFFEGMRGARLPDGFSVHFYTDLRPTKFKAGDFNAEEWHEVLRRGVRLEKVLSDHWAEMGKFDPEHRTKLVVDEWGVWYPPGEEIAPGYILSQPITLREAVHTGLTFDIFNRHAEKIAMANVAQTVNCIHSLFLGHGAEFRRTPVYHVFDLYRPHMGARQVAARTTTSAISCSASMRDGRLTVTVTNPSLDDAMAVRLRGAQATEARATVLTHDDMRATDVRPAPLNVEVRNGSVEFTAPKKSVIGCVLGME